MREGHGDELSKRLHHIQAFPISDAVEMYYRDAIGMRGNT